ncbi:uncharacterized protein DDB_G0283697-like [Eriocheir sinensis]|uniref:uncharacterized protein DDB_G0283697-like n=1 Tax=Eriocheir sinensis TaxID=95602 RepID=UPI0021C914CE|nr:uncharacterized protein DDB_G0283697-like [Eriocheir sinensis]
MDQREVTKKRKKKWRGNEEEEGERRHEEEEDLQWVRKQRSEEGIERERRGRGDRRQRRREGKERGGKERENEQGRLKEGRYEREIFNDHRKGKEIRVRGEREREEEGHEEEERRYERENSSDHIPYHPSVAPYLKWKVFVRGSESVLGGRGVREEEGREEHPFTSTLDGEETRNFYERLTRQTDRQRDRDTDTQRDSETEEDSDTDRDSESHRNTDRHTERGRNKDRDKQEETNRYREGETNINTDNNRQRERHRHSPTNRQRKGCTDTHTDTQKSPPNTHTPTYTPTPHDIHTALRFAENNDVTNLTAMLDQGMSVNTKDVYGWTLLMVAACAGAVDVVRMLLDRKARTGFRDGKGNTALYLATIKGHRRVTEMLVKANKRKIPEIVDERERNAEGTSSETVEDEEYFCDTCEVTVKKRESTKHKASIVHQFKADSGPVRTHYGIPPTNRGYQLLVGQGWDTEGGLGSEKQGQKFPVKTVLKRDREGLGAEGEAKAKARVTHFGPGDVTAVKRGKEGDARVERATTLSKREMRRRKEREQEEEVRLRRMLNEPDY